MYEVGIAPVSSCGNAVRKPCPVDKAAGNRIKYVTGEPEGDAPVVIRTATRYHPLP
jgi:hypothetical protein